MASSVWFIIHHQIPIPSSISQKLHHRSIGPSPVSTCVENMANSKWLIFHIAKPSGNDTEIST